MAIVPYSLKDTPSLIEKLLPVQKLSVESYKERKSGAQTLVWLGSYWKGRKPLILNKACILGALLPATNNPTKDLQVFELLMGMDLGSLKVRLKSNKTFRRSEYQEVEAAGFPLTYLEFVSNALRPEECLDTLFDPIWEEVNNHLGTEAKSFPELVSQLGTMRFGHRPVVADTFSGSGQIPFEAARLGCDVYASDLNPIATMLTWGSLNVVGGTTESRGALQKDQQVLVETVRRETDSLGIESDGNGWRGKVYLYGVEVICPQTGWRVPLLPSLVVSKGYKVVAKLVPVPSEARYEIEIVSGVSDEEISRATQGTIQSDEMVHFVDGAEYRTKISTIRGNYRDAEGKNANGLRLWEKSDFIPRENDIYQERLYAVQWMRPKTKGSGSDYEFRSVTNEDLKRERLVEEYVGAHLGEWQEAGWVPDMKIEPGYNTDQPIRERGWTYWHHLFNPRQLLVGALINRNANVKMRVLFAAQLNYFSKLCTWNRHNGGGGVVQQTFINQALNTLYDYGVRSSTSIFSVVSDPLFKTLPRDRGRQVLTLPANQIQEPCDIAITDPPYGDAVKYEEIYEFFIAWLRKNPPPEFADWTWDSRRALAIKGEDHDFKMEMVAAYSQLAKVMPDNGIQIIMFTHQSGPIWTDMANIVWASGLQVTAAWYVATETDSALRAGSYVKGTILLVCRKRLDKLFTTRGDLAYELEDEVKRQIADLTGLSQSVKDNLYRGENLFQDADLQMAGYAAALRVLTKYSTINGQDMAVESLAPRIRGSKSFVEELIDFSVELANSLLVPEGISVTDWEVLTPEERLYLKMLAIESLGIHKLDNYQNFAKAFKVRDFQALLGDKRANNPRLKTALELEKSGLTNSTLLTGVLYALAELQKDTDGTVVLTHLSMNFPGYFNQRDRLVRILGFLVSKMPMAREGEASAARVLGGLIQNQRFS